MSASAAALRLLVRAGEEKELDSASGPFEHDLVDLASQVVAFAFTDSANLLRAIFNSLKGPMDPAPLDSVASAMTTALNDLDDVLATNPSFLLGHWVAVATKAPNTSTPAEVGNRIFNAKNQVTLWGPSGQIHDYAAKNWAGLVKEYYLPRWSLFSERLSASLKTGDAFNETKYREDSLAHEQAWGKSHEYPPDAVSGTPALEAVKAVMSRHVDAPPEVVALYDVKQGVDYHGNDIVQAFTRDISQLMLLCSQTTECKGFNENGWIKRATGSPSQEPGTTFYLKKEA